jgi:hypothetical protein
MQFAHGEGHCSFLCSYDTIYDFDVYMADQLDLDSWF